MAKKQQYRSKEVAPPEADNLQIITGIGPAVESRLHRVGIFTFAQLSALSPADIAASLLGLPGMTAERIHKQDWIDQARKLSSASTQAQQQESREIVMRSQDYVPFTVEPQDPGEYLNAQQYQAIETTDVAVLMNEQLEAELLAAESLPASTESASPISPLRLIAVETLSPSTRRPHSLFPYGQPFDVCLTFDVMDAALSADAIFYYTASIYARRLGYRERQVIGEIQGDMPPPGTLAATIDGTSLSYGVYLLEAIVTARLASKNSSLHTDLVTNQKGSIVQIY